MSNIDDKLREILHKVGAHNADAIPEIKQALADALFEPPANLDTYRLERLLNKELPELKTGQEFCDRYEQELEKTVFMTYYLNATPSDYHEVLDRELVNKVARKAAGLLSDTSDLDRGY